MQKHQSSKEIGRKRLYVRVIDKKIKKDAWYHLFQTPIEWVATRRSLTVLGLPVGKRLLYKKEGVWFYWGMLRTTPEGAIDPTVVPEYFDETRKELEISLIEKDG